MPPSRLTPLFFGAVSLLVGFALSIMAAVASLCAALVAGTEDVDEVGWCDSEGPTLVQAGAVAPMWRGTGCR